MKNSLTFLALLVSLPLLALAQPRWSGLPQRQNPLPHAPSARQLPSNARISQHQDLPNLRYSFDWNDSTTAWDSTYRNTYTYSPTGLLIENVLDQYFSNAFVPNNREVLSYNLQGWQTDSYYQYWNGSAWENQSRRESGYDAFGNSTLDFDYFWNGASWDSTSGRRSTFSYVFTDKIGKETVEYWDQQNPVWVLSDRNDYHWPNAQGWDSLTFYIYSGTWEPSDRIIIFGWHNLEKEFPDSAIIQTYNGSGWDDDERIDATYGLYDSFDWIYAAKFGNNWIPYMREVLQNDSLDHAILEEGYEWAGTWNQNYGYQHDFFYDVQDRTTEIIHDNWDQGSYSHSTRDVFPTFFTVGTTAILPEVSVRAFPNPCTDRLNFKLLLHENGPVQIALYDMQGRLRMQSTSPSMIDGQVTMPISEFLESGTYLYCVTTTAGEASGKVVVQK